MGNSARKESYRCENKTQVEKRRHKDVVRLRSGIPSSEEKLQKLEDKYADIKQYKFPFENVVLEGGGVKGLAYCGAIQVRAKTCHNT